MKIVVDGKGQCLSPEDWTCSGQFWERLFGQGPNRDGDTQRDEGVTDPRAETGRVGE